MATKHYDWIPGEPPPVLGLHSLAKHKVLEAYLEKYVSILASRPVQDKLRLTLVDGFAGGGAYRHPETSDIISGSPLIMLRAMAAAEHKANLTRRKRFELDVQYFFIEMLAPTVEYLQSQLSESREARERVERITVISGCFSDHLNAIVQKIEQRGRSRRVIFVLDQYGYTDVRMSDLRTIFGRLPNAEVIMTVAIDWLIDHWTDGEKYDGILKNLGLDLDGQFAELVKQQRPIDWRPIIQHALHQQFLAKSGANYYTPFFIHSVEAHRAYWLLHFSGHSKARDVMMQLHWELENHFQHFGRPGFSMLGYDPRRDLVLLGQQKLAFGFDSFAAEETQAALLDELPRRISGFRDGVRFRDFFDRVVNETPATKEMLAEQISKLTLDKELAIKSNNGKSRRNGVQIDDDDIIFLPKQRLLLP